jgi:hypothetical protein
MNAQILEWVGYIASVIIAISLAVSSIVKFRWLNLVGALGFSIYGFLIGAIPVGVLNGIIALVDVYYLFQIYGRKDVFETLEIRPENYYLIRFLEYHNDEIQKFFPGFEYKPDMNTVSFFILRNMAVAGLFLAHREEGNVLKVGLDYVIPEYRDFKNGKYVYLRLRDRFIKAGFTKVVTEGNSIEYIKYLEKLGFKEDENRMFSMDLV